MQAIFSGLAGLFVLALGFAYMVGGRGSAQQVARWTLRVLRRLVGGVLVLAGQILVRVGSWVRGGGRQRQQGRR